MAHAKLGTFLIGTNKTKRAEEELKTSLELSKSYKGAEEAKKTLAHILKENHSIPGTPLRKD